MKITGHTKIYGIIGNPIAHSLSPAMHNAAYAELGLDAVFVAFAANSGRAAVDSARAMGVRGLSVTAPFKADALALCDTVEPAAQKTGAVNTLLLGDRIEGFNTDVDGIRGALSEAGVRTEGARAVVIGMGGTARAVLGALVQSKKTTLCAVVRNVDKAKESIATLSHALKRPIDLLELGSDPADTAIAKADLICQTTPVGWNQEDAPFALSLLHPEQAVLEVVYRTGGTPLMRAALKTGCTVVSGERMLLLQALRQFELFTGRTSPREAMETALYEALEG